MILNINSKENTALYIQVYQEIKAKIHEQLLQTNDRLPSKRELALKNEISQNTVMKAYEQLLTEGYIYSIERKGYFVANTDFLFELPSLDGQIDIKDEHKLDHSFIYDLTHSEPDENIFPFSIFSKLYRNLFNEKNNNILKKSPGQGLYPLRQKIQHYLSISRGIPCNAQQIIIGPSIESLLTILLQLFPDPLNIGIENPGYHGFNQLFLRKSCRIYNIPLTKFGADISILQQKKIQLMLVTSNHQFPTGAIMPLEKRQELLKWAKNQSAYIIENDYDSEFKYSGIPLPSLKQLDKEDQVIHLGSFTRTLAPGIRLSYMVLPQELIKKYQKIFKNYSSSVSTIEQWVTHDFIHNGHLTTHLNRSRLFYKKKRDQMIKEIKKQDPQAQILGENAGLHLLVKPSISFNSYKFKKLTTENKIKIQLLSDFYFNTPKDEDKNILFLSFSNISIEDIPSLIQKLFTLTRLSK